MSLLFSSEPIRLELPEADIIYYPNFLASSESKVIFEELLSNTLWQQDKINVFGKTHLQPRLTALYGNEGKPYSYSNLKMLPHNWTPTLQKIKFYVESLVEANFTTVLLNLYRNGIDSNSWHADNEKELGINPIIASISLGAERNFQLKHINNTILKKNIVLENGSLLVMKGTTQQYWKHQIPKTSKLVGPRINLTFRVIQ